jgi:hypothetical protein
MNELVRMAGPRRRRPTLEALCRERMTLRVPGVLPSDECRALVRRVYAARAEWTSNFAGVQFTLGRAWYTHLEEDREDAYFEGAAASNACVERHLPGMQGKVLELVRGLAGGPVTLRPGWCGPGVHVFPAGSEVAKVGGAVHYDTEGLTDAQIEARAPAISFVLMLQPATTGGGLRVWERFYEGDDFPSIPEAPSERVDYSPGELVAFDSYRLHQILPFGGDVDRISITVHIVKNDGAWEAWF